MSTPRILRPCTQPVAPVVVKPRTPPSPLGRITVGVTIIGLGLLAVIDRISPAIDAEPRHYFALAVTILGLGILTGTFFGRARWLIPIGLLLLPPMIGTSVADAYDGSWQTPQVVRPSGIRQPGPDVRKGRRRTHDRPDRPSLEWRDRSRSTPKSASGNCTSGSRPGSESRPGRCRHRRIRHRRETPTADSESTARSLSKAPASGRLSPTSRLASAASSSIPKATGSSTATNLSVPARLATRSIEVNSTEALEESYSTIAGDITLDLAGLVLTDDRTVDVFTDIGTSPSSCRSTPPIGSWPAPIPAWSTSSGRIRSIGEESVRADSITTGSRSSN